MSRKKVAGIGPTTALVLTPSGNVAWIAIDYYRHPRGSDFQVHKLDRSGEMLLDQGGSIDPHVLAVSQGVLSWLDGGNRRTTPLS